MARVVEFAPFGNYGIFDGTMYNYKEGRYMRETKYHYGTVANENM